MAWALSATENVEYCILVNEWAWLRSQVCLLRLEVDLGRLIPRSSHNPVFDRLQYANMEGEGLVYFGGGGVLHRKNELEALCCSFRPKC